MRYFIYILFFTIINIPIFSDARDSYELERKPKKIALAAKLDQLEENFKKEFKEAKKNKPNIEWRDFLNDKSEKVPQERTHPERIVINTLLAIENGFKEIQDKNIKPFSDLDKKEFIHYIKKLSIKKNAIAIGKYALEDEAAYLQGRINGLIKLFENSCTPPLFSIELHNKLHFDLTKVVHMGYLHDLDKKESRHYLFPEKKTGGGEYYELEEEEEEDEELEYERAAFNAKNYMSREGIKYINDWRDNNTNWKDGGIFWLKDTSNLKKKSISYEVMVRLFDENGQNNFIEYLTNRMNQEINKADKNKEKLLAIIKFVKDLELWHPFTDGNGRTSQTLFAYLSYCHLTKAYYLPNPDDIDFLSPEEIYKKLKSIPSRSQKEVL